MENRINKFIVFLMLFFMVAVTLSPVIATNSTEPQWPKQGYDNQNTGQSPYLGPQNNTTKWNLTLDGNKSEVGPNVAIGSDGTIYFGRDLFFGEEYVGDNYGYFYAVNPNGTIKWNYTLNETNSSVISYAPVIGLDGTIYFGSEFFPDEETNIGRLYALNPDGTLKWKYTLPYNLSEFRISSPSPAISPEGTIYFGTGYIDYDSLYGDFIALNPDGTLKWIYEVKNDSDAAIGTPAVDLNGTIYFGDIYGDITNMQTNIYALNPNGGLKWTRSLSDYGENIVMFISPVIGLDGILYVGTQLLKGGTTLFAFNPDGTLKWNKTFNNTDLSSINCLSYGSDNIYVGINEVHNANIFALNSDGSVKWNKTLGDGIACEKIRDISIGSDGTLYFGVDYGEEGVENNIIYALNPDGTLKWKYSLDNFNYITSSYPAIAKDGSLYFLNLITPNESTFINGLFAIKGQQSSLYVNTTVDNQNPNIGDIIKLTFKVGNNGPDIAYDTVFKYIIPEGMKYINAIVDNGTITYNATTRTITWNLGNVPVGDPYLYLFLQVLKSGSYNIVPTLSTWTYDPNLSDNIGSIIINAQSSSESSKVIAKTVGMQITGLPLGILLIAILMVLGGLTVDRRKK